MQINHLTRAPYTGNNQDALEILKGNKGYTSDEWMTFLQAKQANRTVKKGEHGVRLVKMIEVEKKDDKRSRIAPRGFVVFNFDQTEEITR